MFDYHDNPLQKGQAIIVETMLRPVSGTIISEDIEKYNTIRYRINENLTIGMRPTIKRGTILKTNTAWINQ